MCLLADQCEKIYLKHFELSANDKIGLFKVYFLLKKVHEFIRTVMEMVFEIMNKLIKTVGVFDTFSQKTVTAFKGEALFFFLNKGYFYICFQQHL